jgi:hypothetical protein
VGQSCFENIWNTTLIIRVEPAEGQLRADSNLKCSEANLLLLIAHYRNSYTNHKQCSGMPARPMASRSRAIRSALDWPCLAH